MDVIKILDAIKQKYEAEMSSAILNIQVYKNAVGIGEHPDIVEAVEMQVKRYNEASEMVDAVNQLILEV